MWDLILENDLCDGDLLRVRKGDGCGLHTEPFCKLRGLAVKIHRGLARRQTNNLDILPRYPALPARAYGFQGRFLGSKARGEAFVLVSLGLAVTDLSRGKDAVEKARAVTLDGGLHARNFGDVYSHADDHRR